MKKAKIDFELKGTGSIELLVPDDWDLTKVDDYFRDTEKGLELSASFYVEDKGCKLGWDRGIKNLDIEDVIVHPTNCDFIGGQ